MSVASGTPATATRPAVPWQEVQERFGTSTRPFRCCVGFTVAVVPFQASAASWQVPQAVLVECVPPGSGDVPFPWQEPQATEPAAVQVGAAFAPVLTAPWQYVEAHPPVEVL